MELAMELAYSEQGNLTRVREILDDQIEKYGDQENDKSLYFVTPENFLLSLKVENR